MDLKETNKVMPNPVRLAMIERQDQEQKKKKMIVTQSAQKI